MTSVDSLIELVDGPRIGPAYVGGNRAESSGWDTAGGDARCDRCRRHGLTSYAVGIMLAARPGGGRRPRRSGDEVRRLLLVSARDLFGEKGLAETTTREIIKRAGVSEQSLFSHFESKQGLFEAAMLEPLGEFVRTYVAAGSDASPEEIGSEEMLRRYVEGLYDLIAANRQVFLALSPEQVEHEPARGIIAEIENYSARFAVARALDFDPVFASRAVLSLVVSLALFQDVLLPGYQRKTITDQLTSVLLSGLLNKHS
jgi:AcrR family transcriptional regulator